MRAFGAGGRDLGGNGPVQVVSTGHSKVLVPMRDRATVDGLLDDPVTGNGHGPLGAYLVRHGIVPAPDGRLAFTGRQGSAMGRPGDVEVFLAVQAGGELAVSIAGEAAPAFRTELPG